MFVFLEEKFDFFVVFSWAGIISGVDLSAD